MRMHFQYCDGMTENFRNSARALNKCYMSDAMELAVVLRNKKVCRLARVDVMALHKRNMK